MAGRPRVKEMCAKYWESCSGVNIGEAQNGIAIVFNQVNRCRFLCDDLSLVAKPGRNNVIPNSF